MNLSYLIDHDSGISGSGGWSPPPELPLGSFTLHESGGNIIDLYYYSLFFNRIGTEIRPLFLFVYLVYRPIIWEAWKLKLEYLLVLS